jgi:protein FLOWERING LOCUS T
MPNDSLVTGRVIGEVLDPYRTTVEMTVLYDGRPIINGMEFRAPAISNRPTVEIEGDDISVTYTLVSLPIS